METPNNEYWAERFEALTDELIAGSGAAYDTAEKLFRMAQRDIEADLARWYSRLAANNEISYADARKLLRDDELKEFKWTLEEYIKRGKENGVSADWQKELENASAKFHISRLEAMRVQIRQHLEELYGNYADELDDTMRRTYSDGYYQTAYTLETGFHTGFDVSKLDTDAIDTLLKKPWAADGKNFSDRIWADKDKLLATLQTELVQGLIRGSTQADIVKRFAAKMKTSLSNAARLIATESAYFAAVGEKDGMKALGVEKYRYLATLDSKTSEICREMDGKVFTMAEYKPGVTAPPLHVWCRSTTVPYFGEKGGLRAARNADGKTEYIPAEMRYKDWKEVFVDKQTSLQDWKMRMNLESPNDKFIMEIAKQCGIPYTLGKRGDDRFYGDNGQPIYPLNDGAVGYAENVKLKKGTVILDRYGGDMGFFVSEKGTSFEARSLPRKAKLDDYHVYLVTKDLPNTQKATVAPWFGQRGGGIQYKLPDRIQNLLREFLREATRDEY